MPKRWFPRKRKGAKSSKLEEKINQLEKEIERAETDLRGLLQEQKEAEEALGDFAKRIVASPANGKATREWVALRRQAMEAEQRFQEAKKSVENARSRLAGLQNTRTQWRGKFEE